MATFSQKIRFLQGLLTSEVAKTGPFYVDIDLTRRCNLRCLGCPYHSLYVNIVSPHNPAVVDISLDLLKRLYKELKTMNTHILILQGAGEPFLHPRILEIVSAAKAAGFYLILLTNGTLLDQDTIQALIDARLDTLKVSLWASSSEQYQQNYPGTSCNSFRRVVDGLKLLAGLKAERKTAFPFLQLHYPINRYNFETIDALVDLASGTGCNALSFSPLFPVRGALASFALSPEEERSVRFSLLEARKRLDSLSMGHNIDEVLLRYELGSNGWQKLPCYIAWYHVRIRADGAVQPCGRCNLDMDFGNLHKNTFHEIWNGLAIGAFRREALTGKGPASGGEQCDCSFCCYARDNMRVHQVFRRFSPFGPQLKSEEK